MRKEDAQWVMCTNGAWLAGRNLVHPLVGRRRGVRTGDHQRLNAQTPTDQALLVLGQAFEGATRYAVSGTFLWTVGVPWCVRA